MTWEIFEARVCWPALQEYFEDELKLSTSRNAVEKKRQGGKNSRTLPHQCIYVSQLKRRRITKKWGKPYS